MSAAIKWTLRIVACAAVGYISLLFAVAGIAVFQTGLAMGEYFLETHSADDLFDAMFCFGMAAAALLIAIGIPSAVVFVYLDPHNNSEETP